MSDKWDDARSVILELAHDYERIPEAHRRLMICLTELDDAKEAVIERKTVLLLRESQYADTDRERRADLKVVKDDEDSTRDQLRWEGDPAA